MLADRIRMSSYKGKKLIDRTTPTIVVNQPHSTEGNGGRKLVRLENGWLVSGVRDTTATPHMVRLYVSKDDGSTWSQLCYIQQSTTGNLNDVSIQNMGNRLYILANYNNINVMSWSIDSLTIRNENIYTQRVIINNNEITIGNVSLVINKEGTELHACWSSKNATYPNSFNIRYCKGIISGDGSVTWGSVEQISKITSSSINAIHPCIICDKLGKPIIISTRDHSGATINALMCNIFNGTSWQTSNSGQGLPIYDGGAYQQSSPSACVDKDGVIHVVWNRYDGTYYRISYSKSIDGGVTWSTPKNILIVNIDSKPSIASNANGEVFVEFRSGGRVYSYKSTDKGETWSSSSILYLDNPSLLDDNTIEFEEPLNICMTTSSHATFPNSVIFRGKWYDSEVTI